MPQGSVLGPVLFLVNVSDLQEGIRPHVNMFVDDAKLMAKISNVKDSKILQGSLDTTEA